MQNCTASGKTEKTEVEEVAVLLLIKKKKKQAATNSESDLASSQKDGKENRREKLPQPPQKLPHKFGMKLLILIVGFFLMPYT